MKLFFKAGLMSAAMLSALALSPAAHAAGYAVNPNYGTRLDVNAGSAVVASSDLPMNRGVGRGSNKGMMDLNRGFGAAVTAEPMSGYYDRAAYGGAGMRDSEYRRNIDAGWNDSRDNGRWDRNAPNDMNVRADGSYRDGNYRTDANGRMIRTRGYGQRGVSMDASRRGRFDHNVNSDIHSNPPIGEGSNRSNSSLDTETR